MIALPPDVVRWIHRSGEDPDCGITALALACGQTYDAVLGEAVKIEPKAVTWGLRIRDMRKVAAKFGFSTRLLRKFDLNEDTGILSVSGPEGEHVVYLWEGRIIEPRQDSRSLWLDPHDFLEHHLWDAKALITVKKKDSTMPGKKA